MLGKFTNMAELSRQMDRKEGQRIVDDVLMEWSGAPLLKGGQGALAGGKTSVIAAKAVRDGRNVPGEGLSDIQLCGVRLDQRAELVKLAQPLLDQGLSEHEVQVAVAEFVKRKKWAPLSPIVLEGIVDSALNALFDAELAADAAEQAASLLPQADELQEVSLADIRPEPVRWLWPGKIPLGRVTVMYGEAGIGKTSLGLDLAARVSAGTHWPDGSGVPESGRVLMVNGEDSVGDSICPRLTSSGANLKNISVIAGMQPPKTPGSAGVAAGGTGAVRGATAVRGFDLGRDLPVLRSRIETLGNVRLVIIDPLEAYLGKVGANRGKLRELVASLSKLAADCGVAIVVVSAATKCDLPVKHVWRVDCEVLDATARCWVPVRHNCGPLPVGLAFRINADGVVWSQGREVPTESRMRGTSARQARCRQLQEQANWLREYLAGEARPAKDVLAAAGAAGWSTGQIKRAKWELGIHCYKESVAKGRCFWSACGEKVEGSELRVDSRQVAEIKEVNEFKEVA